MNTKRTHAQILAAIAREVYEQQKREHPLPPTGTFVLATSSHDPSWDWTLPERYQA
jgi:hypothetical protein